MENNPRYSKYEDKFIIGKSTIEKENFDVLIFCNRDVKNAKIPNFIEIIGSYAFDQCYKLQKVEIPDDSKLRKIGKYSFSFSSIESIKISHHITHIDEGAFFSCYQLQHAEIPTNSELQIIDKYAFNSTSIESINIPSSVIELGEGWAKMTTNLNKIKIMENNQRYSLCEDKYIIEKSSIEKDNFDVLIFSINDIKIASIPSFIKIIGQRTFYGYTKIEKVEIPDDSKLKIIDKYTFCCILIKRISIPPLLTHIKEFQFIGEKSFFNSPVSSIFIPKNAIEIDELAFYSCKQLQIFEIDENSEIEKIHKNIFLDCEKVIVMISAKLRIILFKFFCQSNHDLSLNNFFSSYYFIFKF